MLILKRALLLSVLLIALLAIGFVVYTVGKLVVSATLGREIVNGGSFYFAVAILTLMIFFFVIVFAMHTWDKLKSSIRDGHPKASKR